MGGILNFFFVLIWLCCAPAIPQRNCSDCVVYTSCGAAIVAIQKRDPVKDDQLRNAFCGFDGDKLPMVCCSELTVEALSPLVESVETHPHLRLLPSSHTCGYGEEDSSTYKIIIGGGRRPGLYEFPWMVLLAYKTRQGPQFKCVGSLINERYVLTAAHCVSGQEVLGVRIGEYNIETALDCQDGKINTCESIIQDVRVEEAIPHPDYHGKPAIRNDIGLLRLKKPVNLTFKNAGTICLPVTSGLQNRNISKLGGTVAGWGFTEEGYASPKLLAVSVPIHNGDYCRQLYNRGRKPGEEDDTINKFCAGLNGKDACRGDSGGPLMVRGGSKREPYFQYGIVSYGPSLCGSDFPGIYTDVSKYVKWILDSIKP